MVPEGAAEGPCALGLCVLPAVLGSGSGMFMVREKGLRRIQETCPDV